MEFISQIDWQTVWKGAQWIASTVIIPLALAFIKSEQWGNDPNVPQNGWCHYIKLIRQAIASLPAPVIQAAEAKINVVVPGSSQIIEALTGKKENTNEETVSVPPAAPIA